MAEFIKSECPHCGQSVEYSPEGTGQTVPCPTCAEDFILTPSQPYRPIASPPQSPPTPPASFQETAPSTPSAPPAAPKSRRRILDWIWPRSTRVPASPASATLAPLSFSPRLPATSPAAIAQPNPSPAPELTAETEPLGLFAWNPPVPAPAALSTPAPAATQPSPPPPGTQPRPATLKPLNDVWLAAAPPTPASVPAPALNAAALLPAKKTRPLPPLDQAVAEFENDQAFAGRTPTREQVARAWALARYKSENEINVPSHPEVVVALKKLFPEFRSSKPVLSHSRSTSHSRPSK